MGKIINHKGHHGGRYDDPHGVTAPKEQPDWSSLTDDEWGYSTIFPRSTPAETIKKKYAERGMDQV
jgi:hypothetical protein